MISSHVPDANPPTIELFAFASEIGPGFSPDIAEAIATGFSRRDSFSYNLSPQFKEATS